jgi:hypothetical protein
VSKPLPVCAPSFFLADVARCGAEASCRRSRAGAATTPSSDECHCSPPRCSSSALSPPTYPSGELPRLTPCRVHALRLPRAWAASLAPPRATVRRRRPRHRTGPPTRPVAGRANLVWAELAPHGLGPKPRPGTVSAGNLFSISFNSQKTAQASKIRRNL